MISSLSQQRVNEIAGSESAGDKGSNPFTIGRLNSYLITDMCEYLMMTHAQKRELAEIRVG